MYGSPIVFFLLHEKAVKQKTEDKITTNLKSAFMKTISYDGDAPLPQECYAHLLVLGTRQPNPDHKLHGVVHRRSPRNHPQLNTAQSACKAKQTRVDFLAVAACDIPRFVRLRSGFNAFADAILIFRLTTS
jgi:hypothetical protein